MIANDLDTEYIPTDTKNKVSIPDLHFLTLLKDLFAETRSESCTFDGLVYYCDYSINSSDEFLPLPTDAIDTYLR